MIPPSNKLNWQSWWAETVKEHMVSIKKEKRKEQQPQKLVWH